MIEIPRGETALQKMDRLHVALEISLLLSLLCLESVLTWAGGQVLYLVTLCYTTGFESHEMVPFVETSFCFSAALLSN